ncbi:hypothetical protein [Sporomusa acidovorans]|uniref:Potassium channel domain-containing protein n=1 Tax=Sporomusa acidovorans (strain ATCC 49682 / DSM 3132 / Mol) TaxID=1123286 RepID=A0ABZ3J4P8_SPOA4|nr:hypothetical protein [Sporomusa acidovorans]OZC23969.1 hypothetical protein SPACI_03870 [Sporomusa acidovorans DSM 3132]SDF84678.1 hypothetical protein SAMN04488499_11002 [Sporomusa acidovorans]
MVNGFIIVCVEYLMRIMNKLSAVKLFKSLAKKVLKTNNREIELRNTNIIIDVYIVMKWFLICCFWSFGYNSNFCIAITIYLILNNLQIYFYHHIWSVRAITNEQISVDRMKRRFVNLILAIAYSVFCFGYLYEECFPTHYDGWPEKYNKFLTALYYSMSNAIKGAGVLTPNDNTGLIISVTQFVTTYIFLTMMVSKAVPQYTEKKKGE